MATIPLVIDKHQDAQESVVVGSWTGLVGVGDIGAPMGFAAWSGKTVQCSGNFSGGVNVIMEGSNDLDAPTNWSQISNWNLTGISFAAAGIQTAKDMPLWIRPRLTAGAGGGSVNVVVACHRQDMAGMAR